MKTIKLTSLAMSFCLSLLCFSSSRANNLYISAPITYTPASQTLTFSISWDNSWYNLGAAPNNYDAVWLFVKYQACNAGVSSPWVHVNLSTLSTDHSIIRTGQSYMNIDAVADGKGVFIHRNILGSGNTQVWTVTLKISPTLAATCAAATSCNWKVFGIEMVNVPQVAYAIGDGSGTTTNPFIAQAINTEAAITAAALGGTATVDLPATYPKGYNSFYCMKQEISQEQYTSFLNTLQYNQQVSRTLLAPDYAAVGSSWALTLNNATATNRNGIRIQTAGINNFMPAIYAVDQNNNGLMNESTLDALHLPCNYLSWADVVAFLDWAALRPMSDMEYEKVCRGTVAALADEYPWGTLTTTSATSATLNNINNTTEVSTALLSPGLCVYGGLPTNGPIRGGASAASTTSREQAGAAYYGALEMAGNVWEPVVGVYDAPTVAAFSNIAASFLGDGTLNAAGDANQAAWPGIAATGTGRRGGSWLTAATTELRTSDRSFATTTDNLRDKTYGGRGVR